MSLSTEPVHRNWETDPVLVRGSAPRQTASPGTSVPMEDVAAEGRGIVPRLRRSRSSDGFGAIRDIYGVMQQENEFADG